MFRPTVSALFFAVCACNAEQPVAPPVVVVPGDNPAAVAATEAWGNSAGDESNEPVDVIQVLREYDAELSDPANDVAAGGYAWDDLLTAFAVMDERRVMARIATRAPMNVRKGESRELRFWFEQAGKMVTVEVKVGSQGNPCELQPPDGAETVVPSCFWAGNAIDIAIPRDKIPAIDLSQPFWVSGFQTCCVDAERNQPYDSLEAAQEVWRVRRPEAGGIGVAPFQPGAASEPAAAPAVAAPAAPPGAAQ